MAYNETPYIRKERIEMKVVAVYTAIVATANLTTLIIAAVEMRKMKKQYSDEVAAVRDNTNKTLGKIKSALADFEV